MPNPVGTGVPNPTSYTVDAANNVVTDNVTGLVWQRTVAPGTYTWDQAKQYCANLVLAAHSDWRLPTRIELVSLVDFTKSNPAIDSTAFPNTPSNWFWTSSPEAGNPTLAAWFVHFVNGSPGPYGVAVPVQVRCVR